MSRVLNLFGLFGLLVGGVGLAGCSPMDKGVSEGQSGISFEQVWKTSEMRSGETDEGLVRALPSLPLKGDGKHLWLNITERKMPQKDAETTETRATIIKEDNFTSMGVFAFMDQETSANYFSDLEVSKSSLYTTSYFWPGASHKLSFLAYAPYGSMKVDAGNGFKSFDYSVPTDLSKQQDLLIARSTTYQGDYGQSVPLHLRHMLMGVNFEVANTLFDCTIKSIQVDVPANGTFLLGSTMDWDYTKDDTKSVSTYLLPVNKAHTKGTPTILSTEPLLLMPSSKLPTSAKITITLTNVPYFDPAKELVLTAELGGTNYLTRSKLLTFSISSEALTTILEVPTASVVMEGGLSGSLPFDIQSYAQFKTDTKTETIPLGWTVEYSEGYKNSADSLVYADWTTIPPKWLSGMGDNPQPAADLTKASAILAPQDSIIVRDRNLKLASPRTNYDLSTYGGSTPRNTANCYVVNAPGTYLIPLVVGNSIKNDALNRPAFEHAIQADYLEWFRGYDGLPVRDNYGFILKNAATSKILWQDGLHAPSYTTVIINPEIVFGSTYLADQGGGGNKYLKFEVPAATIAQSNAVIAVQDQNSKIMWSWHIWVTDIDITKEVSNTTSHKLLKAPVGFRDWNRTFVERRVKVRVTQSKTAQTKEFEIVHTKPNRTNTIYKNLWFAPYYQWGRKDPFPDVSVLSLADSRTDAEFFGEAGYLQAPASGGIGETIQRPNTFYWRSLPNTGGEYWLRNDESYLNLWNNGTNTSQKEVIKTIYDPSPVGYVLPLRNTVYGNEDIKTYYKEFLLGYREGTQVKIIKKGTDMDFWSAETNSDGKAGGYIMYWLNGDRWVLPTSIQVRNKVNGMCVLPVKE